MIFAAIKHKHLSLNNCYNRTRIALWLITLEIQLDKWSKVCRKKLVETSLESSTWIMFFLKTGFCVFRQVASGNLNVA